MAYWDQQDDIGIVRECLSGSEAAWRLFHKKYNGLVRCVVRGHLAGATPQDIEDVTQNTFLELLSVLGNYDGSYPLPKFVGGVAKRTARDEYRRRSTAIRNADTNPIDSTGCGNPGEVRLSSTVPGPEEAFGNFELQSILVRGFQALGARCQEIIRLRDYEELSYQEMEAKLGEKANTLTQTRLRCLDELKVICDRLLRKGCRR